MNPSEQQDGFEERLKALEEQNSALQDRLNKVEADNVEQEWRALILLKNIWKRRDWPAVSAFLRWLLFGGPGGIVIAFGGLGTLLLAFWANQLLKDQNILIDKQNEELIRQFRVQSEQFETDAKRAAIEVLTRTRPCPGWRGLMGKECAEPTRARQEALDAYLRLTQTSSASDLSNTQLVGLDLHDRSLEGAYLFKANLQRASGGLFERALLREADLRDGNLRMATFHKAYLMGADLRGAWLWYANLQQAVLIEADLRKADLKGANLQIANLYKADLRQANLEDVDLWRADLRNADVRGSTLTIAGPLVSCFDEKTKWPEGFIPPEPDCSGSN